MNMWYWDKKKKKKNRPVEKHREFKNRPVCIYNTDFQHRCKSNSMEKEQSFEQMIQNNWCKIK